MPQEKKRKSFNLLKFAQLISKNSKVQVIVTKTKKN